jgi:putative ABC transport system permease protein
MIKINKLDKYFNKGKSNEIHVINNTCLEFGNTGLVCILGESGSGKTTLLNTIGGLDTFQKGSITIDDKKITRYSSKEVEKLRNSRFGYIFQDQYLLQDYTVAYNIRLALNMFDISEEEKESRIDYVLQAVDMKKYKKRLVSQLSGGQQQRIAIARALVKTPDIIFADEPTGNLDEVNTMRVMSIIKKISKECLVILVTHEKRIAEFFADRIIYIQDGKVVTDHHHNSKHTYKYSEDTNLYLKEFNKETYRNNNISINLYHDGENNEILLNMVSSNGKLYIQTPREAEVVFLTSGDEMQMVDDVKPEIGLEQIEEFEYSLSKLEKEKRSKLSFREIYKLAQENVRMLGKKQIFMIVSFLITSILLVMAVADYMTLSAIDKKAIVTEDSHYINVMARRNSSASNEEYFEGFNEIYQSISKSNIAEDIYIDLNTKLSFTYEGFAQIKKLDYSMLDFSYVTLEHLKKEDLILGRMPEHRNEIVIDRWLIDVFEDSNSVLKKLMPDMEDFLDLKLRSDIMGQTLTIVGICDVEEPTVFIDKYAGISIASWADPIASLEQLQAEYPDQFRNITLASNEVLVSEATKNYMEAKGMDVFVAKNGAQYKVIGTFPDEFKASYVIEDKNYRDVMDRYIQDNRRFMIYSDQESQPKIMDYFTNNLGGFNTTYVKLIVSDTYRQQMKKYQAERALKLNSRLVVTITIFGLSLFMLYFTMKSNVIKRAQELTVYRLMGITKRSILSAYALEIIMVTSYTVLPIVLVFSTIIKFIAGIPSFEANIVYPWLAVYLLLAFIYGANLIVGLIPAYHIVKLPPAQLAEKS